METSELQMGCTMGLEHLKSGSKAFPTALLYRKSDVFCHCAPLGSQSPRHFYTELLFLVGIRWWQEPLQKRRDTKGFNLVGFGTCFPDIQPKIEQPEIFSVYGLSPKHKREPAKMWRPAKSYWQSILSVAHSFGLEQSTSFSGEPTSGCQNKKTEPGRSASSLGWRLSLSSHVQFLCVVCLSPGLHEGLSDGCPRNTAGGPTFAVRTQAVPFQSEGAWPLVWGGRASR